MERTQEVMVAFSESVMWNGAKRPLAEKSRWLHIRLVIKPRYLGNHASQIIRYYGTLLRSQGCFFRFSQYNLRFAPPGWRKIQLAIKPRFLGKNASHIKSYYGTLSGSHGRSFKTYIVKQGVRRPLAEDWRKPHIQLAIKPRYLGNIHRR